MKIIKKENRIYFDTNLSYGNISIHNDYIKLELIRVHEEHTGNGFASKLLEQIIQYVKENFLHKKIVLSSMPISIGGQKNKTFILQQLIDFYKRHKFKESNETTREEPYLMVRYL